LSRLYANTIESVGLRKCQY